MDFKTQWEDMIEESTIGHDWIRQQVRKQMLIDALKRLEEEGANDESIRYSK